MMRTGYYAEALVRYAAGKKLIDRQDENYFRNSLCDVLGLEAPYTGRDESFPSALYDITAALCSAAKARGIVSGSAGDEDRFVAKLMGLATPRPSEVTSRFFSLYKEHHGAATDFLYSMSVDNAYIRMDRIAKNIGWQTTTPYGDMQITINLSKPEKDPKEIIAAQTESHSYPPCLLCRENEGFAGKGSLPARQNLRMVPVTLAGEEWFLQYSPYVYYNEHCIVLKKDHAPMRLSRKTFERLTDFVEIFPHYFLGSNADLPIVGGSILSHDHFQGGRHLFPMQKARTGKEYFCAEFPGVSAQMLEWPMSVIRLRSQTRGDLVDAAEYIYESWKNYSDPALDILSSSAGVVHNTVTPVARRHGSLYEMDIVLRNNRTNDDFPDGIFHPHRYLHHIKKENIGLIEVMGLAILPGRLSKELTVCGDVLKGVRPADVMQQEDMIKHAEWISELRGRYKDGGIDAEKVIRIETARRFQEVLECAGVFKCTQQGREGFGRFLSTIHFERGYDHDRFI
jgi:UDPglucose--hexose-1-phosphate uridylyltransferase